MKTDLTPEEVEVLAEILKRALAEIPIEIHHCSTPDFKQHLKDKQKILESISKKLQP